MALDCSEAKRPRGPNQLAKSIIDIAMGVADRDPTREEPGKDPAAVALSRRAARLGPRE
jgi:hypothetical protein